MNTILVGQAAPFSVTMTQDGAALPIASGSTVTARLYSADGATALTPSLTLLSSTTGADWANGVLVGTILQVDTVGLTPGQAMLVITSTSPARVKRFKVSVESAGTVVRSQLFVRDIVIDELRADQLLSVASTVLPGVSVSDDYLWQKLISAESEIAHELRVPLVPTAFFPLQPTNDEITALNGMPWAIDPAYDYERDFFQGDRWGYIITRQKPVISVSRVRFAYPAPTNGFYDFPADWLRMDAKYGHLRFVPASAAFTAPLNAFLMQSLSGGRMIPHMIQVNYVAGLANAALDYPELLDVIKKSAVLKIVEDSFLPQSGSISADGLSQSFGADVAKYHETVDRILNGPKGANGGLMTAIHGVRLGVI